MKPIGPLMWEHRVIEKMLGVVSREIDKIKATNQADPVFVDTVVDFIRTYADRTHHGKEEDILFRELSKKQMSPELKKIMDELVEEHIFARGKVKSLVEAKELYVNGDTSKVKEIARLLGELASFYPVHIEKEDKQFFYQSMGYLSNDEMQTMLHEFDEFDKRMIHEKYEKVVEGFTGGKLFSSGR
jgi:hemerythrin-like domain-containing protein